MKWKKHAVASEIHNLVSNECNVLYNLESFLRFNSSDLQDMDKTLIRKLIADHKQHLQTLFAMTERYDGNTQMTPYVIDCNIPYKAQQLSPELERKLEEFQQVARPTT